ncbi:DUF6291 domain-containing protein [Zunongwangia sp. F260]|uniref:DUF6291 domain-containing protein n=1 Tax=Autumnicola lenta TaxID=3075593 RepID=A0ABU3CJ01_9FLAO|nr:DUF6291 domain-containing protein [Zunongwangia sp. F260]MDT0646319.1 DUF6291 domain-containing protein [Zunongwangia sp. F260]
MAEGKNSFVLYKDIIHTVKKLPKDKQADLFVTILEYVNDLNPDVEDPFVDLAFEPIKQSLKRDLKKYESICERNQINGKKGGRPPKPTKPNGLNGNQADNAKPKKADSDSESESVMDSESEKDTIINNSAFAENSKSSIQWLETISMQQKVKPDVVKIYIGTFEDHLITMEEQKESEKDFKKHFVHWFNKQDLSMHRKNPIGKSNQIQ